MENINGIAVRGICSLIACAAFGVQFNIRFKHLSAAAAGSLISYLIYTLLEHNGLAEIKCCFIAAAAVSLYSEIMAKLRKAPVNMYLIVGIIPLVPGGMTYYAMLALVMGENSLFLDRTVTAFGDAGAIAMGIFAVSSAVRLAKSLKNTADKALVAASAADDKKPKGQ